MAELTPKTINELPNQTAAEMADTDLFALSSQSNSKRLSWANLKAALATALFPLPVTSGGTGAATANLALQHLGVTIPNGWTLEFSYSGGSFNLDFVLSDSERYRLTWWSNGISYQALINGEWQTIWVK